MVKILLVTNMFPTKCNPSRGTFVKVIADGLQDYYSLQVLALRPSSVRWLKLLCYISFYFRVLLACLGHRNEWVYSHFVSHTSLPLLIVKSICPQFFKWCVNVHGSDVMLEKGRSRFGHSLKVLISKLAFKYADKVVVPSVYYKTILLNYFPSLDHEKIIISPSGGIMDAKSTLRPRPAVLRFCYIGRFTSDKGVKDLGYALGELPNDYEFKMQIAGVGDCKEWFVTHVARLKNCIQFDDAGEIAHSDVSSFLSACDVVVFPSKRRSESLGLVGLEAMNAGALLVTVNDFGPATYAIDNVNALLFTPGDIHSLSGTLKRCFDLDDESFKRIVSAGQRDSLKFETSVVVKELAKIFDE